MLHRSTLRWILGENAPALMDVFFEARHDFLQLMLRFKEALLAGSDLNLTHQEGSMSDNLESLMRRIGFFDSDDNIRSAEKPCIDRNGWYVNGENPSELALIAEPVVKLIDVNGGELGDVLASPECLLDDNQIHRTYKLLLILRLADIGTSNGCPGTPLGYADPRIQAAGRRLLGI
jgi:hypothetical protein